MKKVTTDINENFWDDSNSEILRTDNLQRYLNNKKILGYDISIGKDYTCFIYGKRLKDGTLKIKKIKYLPESNNNKTKNRLIAFLLGIIFVLISVMYFTGFRI
jgi:hypothetical protein